MEKTRPMLFSGPMVRAILSGRKTQTRRVVKPQPDKTLDGEPYWSVGGFRLSPLAQKPLEPVYAWGSTIWVRETWATATSDNGPCICYQADCNRHYLVDDAYPVEYERYPNAGTDAWCNWASDLEAGTEGRWKPSIHMPRWASRITLEVTGVRVERLQEITEEDAKAEGVGASEAAEMPDGKPCYSLPFQMLWSCMYGTDTPRSWDANPWVWVVEFKVTEPAGMARPATLEPRG